MLASAGSSRRITPTQCCANSIFMQLRRLETYLLRLYGDWFEGLRLMSSPDALVYTAASVRPSFKPITLVGVFSLTICLSCLTSCEVHCLPVLRVYYGIKNLLYRVFKKRYSRAAAAPNIRTAVSCELCGCCPNACVTVCSQLFDTASYRRG